MVICRYFCFTLQTSNKSRLSVLLFLRDSHLSCSRMPVILPSSKVLFLVTNLAARFCTFSNSSWGHLVLGSQTEHHAASLIYWGQENKFPFKNPSVLLALVQILVIWVFHFKSFANVTTRYLMLSALSNTVPSRV